MTKTEEPIRIAVIVDVVFSAFQEAIRMGVCDYVSSVGAEAVFCGVGQLNASDPEDRARAKLLKLVDSKSFQGMIVVSTTLLNTGGSSWLASLLRERLDIPMVSIGPSVIGEDRVGVDNHAGMRSMMRHLIQEHGYRKLAFVSGPLTNEESQIRFGEYRLALDLAEIPFDQTLVYEGDFLPPSGIDAVQALWDYRIDRPEVIICSNDHMAAGVWEGLTRRGVVVPHDVAVTGFDDMQLHLQGTHELTTVRQATYAHSYEAARILLDKIINSEISFNAREVTLPATLVLRTSCGCQKTYREEPPQNDKARNPFFDQFRQEIQNYNGAENKTAAEVAVSRAWVRGVHESLRAGHSTQEMRSRLFEIGRDLPGFHSYYERLLEESGQAAFVGHWAERFAGIRLRRAVERFRQSLISTLDMNASMSELDAVVQACGASVFVFGRFLDSLIPEKGSETVYCHGVELPPVVEGIDGLIPRLEIPIAANLIGDDERAFGYLLISADLEHLDDYEYIRANAQAIVREYLAIKTIDDLNANLLKEIKQKEDAEQQLKEAFALVEQLSLEDDLTKLNNRRGFLSLAKQQIAFLRRQKEGCCILFADLDGLKTINDVYGHRDGDLAIMSAARVLKGALRDSDIIARLGGDEFAALVNISDPSSIERVSQRIRQECERVSTELGRSWNLSMSIGHYYAGPECALTIEAMLELADEFLYKEKAEKRARGVGR